MCLSFSIYTLLFVLDEIMNRSKANYSNIDLDVMQDNHFTFFCGHDIMSKVQVERNKENKPYIMDMTL